MNAVLIHPTIFPQDILSRPADALARVIKEKQEDSLRPCAFHKNEDLVELLEFYNSPHAACDTVVIFRDLLPEGKKFMMSFIDDEDQAENLVASVLHNEAHKVFGKAAVTCVSETGDKIHAIEPDDVIRILLRRAWHIGVHVTPTRQEEVEIDNAWNLRGGSSLRLKKKRINQDGHLEITDGDDTWLFAFLDENRKVLIDLPIVCVRNAAAFL